MKENLIMEKEVLTREEWLHQLNELGISSVIVDDRAFKAQLGIGEEAYTSLRIRNRLADIWEVAGAAGTGATIASMPFVGSLFFTSGLMGLIGFTAATPIGWVIGSATLSGLGWLAIRKIFLKQASKKVEVIPKFINSPVDVLGLAILDLLVPIALKTSIIDGEIHSEERKQIKNYFVGTWGYEPAIIDFEMYFIETYLENFEIKEIAKNLAKFAKENKDCNFDIIVKKIVDFLHELNRADGKIHENEEIAIGEVERIFKKEAPWSIFT